jgi:hypothetical protein
MNMIAPSLLLALLAGSTSAGAAPLQHIDASRPLPRFELLQPGVHHYLRFLRSGGSSRPLDILTREVRFENKAGRPLVQLLQRVDAGGTAPSTSSIEAWFDAGTLRPLTHERVRERDGSRTVEGFTFSARQVLGLANLPENAQKDLKLDLAEPTYNFEADLELLQALPLAEGQDFEINFYHPGGAKPQRYIFRVTGTATIPGPAGPVDCWVVTTSYNAPGPASVFWFAKGSQLMIRQESETARGTFVKTLLD